MYSSKGGFPSKGGKGKSSGGGKQAPPQPAKGGPSTYANPRMTPNMYDAYMANSQYNPAEEGQQV